jgi:hypothetical protein
VKNSLAKANGLFLLGGLCIVALFAYLGLGPKPAEAVANNQTINFQGRLLNSQGAAVNDGFYNIEFKIYQDGDGQSAGDTTGSPAGTLKWTEAHLNSASHGVKVVNGFLSVQLGSVTAFGTSIDWNQGNLWLSMNIGDTSSCTITTDFTTDCNGDGEMLPMQPLTASPYAMNSGRLGGLLSTNFVQLAQGVQTDNTTASSIGINKTGASGDILQLQKGGVNVVRVDNSGSLILGQAGTGGQNGSLVFSTTNASNSTITINAASTATSYTLTLPTAGPALGECLQNDGTTLGQLTFGPCGANGTFLSKDTTDTSQADAGGGFLYTFTNTGTAGTGGVLSLDNSDNTGSAFSVTTSGNPAAGKAVIYGQNTNASPSGNLLDLESGSTPTSKFSVDAAGNVSLGGASPVTIQGTASNGTLNIKANGTGILALDTSGAGTINVANSNATSINVGSGSVTSTIVVQSSGISQTITGSATTPSDIIKTGTDSSSAFQVQNHNSQSVFGVDTLANQAVLGQSSAVDGSLLFKNSASGHGITLNSTGANTDYTLTLPAQAPSGGLCIQTSTGNASQLVFASCANNNTSISQVAYWDANATNVITGVTPSTIGDVIVLTTQIPNAGVTVSGISSTNVTTWNKVVANNGNGTVSRVEMWVGTVTSLATSNITVTYVGGTASGEEVTATEFTAAGVNQSTSWGIESSNALLNTTPNTTVNYPSLTAVNGAELYIGYAQVQNPPATTNNTTGFSYKQTNTQHNMVTYDPSLTANTAYQPTALQGSSGQSNTVAAILTAFVTSTAINNSTSLQKANFYVQAANSGSVAGVLQAASSGSADILDLRNSAGANVLTASSTGDVAIKSAGSTTAFQVQNSSNYAVMSVDTTGGQVVVGDATHLSGKITFADSGDSNTISIQAPSTIATSYSLKLPNNSPTAGLCLATSPSDANQLIFSSCATQVSAATISFVNEWDSHGTGVTNIAGVSPTSVGNLMVFYSHTGSGGTINTISGGGVPAGGWTKVTAYTGAGTPGNIEMWRGVVTTAGASAINVTYTGTAGTNEIVAEEFTMGSANGTWAIDTSGTATSTSNVATVNYPNLTPLNSNELYTGYAYGGGTMSLSSPTTGFTYVPTGFPKYLTYKTNVAGGTPYQPVAQQTSGVYASIAALVEAYVGTSVIVNTTSTQQANFNVQASVSGTVAGILQAATSGTADIFEALDSSGNNVMSINGSTGVTLGESTVAGGTLVFNAGSNSNTVTITAPSTPGTNILLKLPSAQAAPGQCLSASPSDSTQLVFSSCANQVTSVAINFVNSWNNSGNGVTTIPTVSAVNLNDLMVLFSSPRGSGSISNVSGGGVTVWSKVASTTTGSGADTTSIDMWKGVVTSTGASPISVTFSGSTGNPNELAAMEFSTGSNTGSWVVDASNTQYNGTSSTSMTFPSLTPQSSRDLYVGYGSGGTYSSGCYTGFTCLAGALGNRVGIYNTSISASTQPVVTTTSAASLTVGALIAAYSSSSVISNSTVTQQANFNIQAATSTSVAGVLQAFPGSSTDILQIMDDTSAVVDSFSSTGNLLVKPSTVSASAFQVQTNGGVNVLSADTNGKRVVVGAGVTGESAVSLLVLDSQTGNTADLATAVNGAMYYNASTHEFRCAAAGAWQNCSGLIYSNVSTPTINNCSNNCAAFSTAAAIPANYCQTGRVINLRASGYYSSLATASNLQFGVYYGLDGSVAANDVLIGSLPPTVSVSSASNNYFQLDFTANCFSTSSIMAEGNLSIQVGSAGSGLTTVPLNATSGTTVTTTSAQNLYIFPIWGTASTSNTATITQLNVSSP